MSNIKQKAILGHYVDKETGKKYTSIDDILRTLGTTGQIKVPDLGIFQIKNVKARLGYNIATGRKITVPAHNKIVFRPTQSLKDSIQKYE